MKHRATEPSITKNQILQWINSTLNVLLTQLRAIKPKYSLLVMEWYIVCLWTTTTRIRFLRTKLLWCPETIWTTRWILRNCKRPCYCKISRLSILMYAFLLYRSFGSLKCRISITGNWSPNSIDTLTSMPKIPIKIHKNSAIKTKANSPPI